LEKKKADTRTPTAAGLWEQMSAPHNNFHPTVKPIALMEYLIKLVSREGHTVLDPFAGSFTTGIACINLDRKFIGIERDPEYFKIGKARIDYVIKKKSSSLFSYDKTGKEE
jgi:DNA modification methylase